MKPRRHTLLFDARFAPLIAAGTKSHTIRPPRKREILPGDLLSLRAWTDKPYRSAQAELRRAVCTKIGSIRLSQRDYRGVLLQEVEIDGRLLHPDCAEKLATRDGFSTLTEMLDYHREHFGLDRDLLLIDWREQ
ncbi:MAG: ASCH domain-containing protein [Pirellulales bacterium]